MAYIGQEPGQGQAERFLFTASGSETTVTTADDGRTIGYTVGQVSVYLNGVKLVVGTGKDCQAANGSTITGLSALTASDVVEVIALSAFSASNTVAATGGTFTGNVVVGATSGNQTLDVASHDLVDGGLKLAGTLVTASATELNLLDGKTSVGGLDEVDMWRLTSGFTNAATPITSNLARVNDTATTLLGTGMGESSGIFTFPSTGYWYVYFQAARYVNGDDRSMACKIYVTVNNSSYLLATEGSGNVKDFSDNGSSTQSCFKIVDVTDTANVKVQFHVSCVNTGTGTSGDTDQSRTSMLFMRLGDT